MNKFIIAVFLILNPFISPAFAAEIKGLRLKQDNSMLLVGADLDKAISDLMEEEILNGMEKEIYYYIVLKKDQKLWIDEEILDITVKYTIKYDLLKKQFEVTTGEDSSIIQDFETAKKIIGKIDNIEVINTSHLNKKMKYYISVKAVMKKKVPFYIDYLLFFIPILELDTPWKNSRSIKW